MLNKADFQYIQEGVASACYPLLISVGEGVKERRKSEWPVQNYNKPIMDFPSLIRIST